MDRSERILVVDDEEPVRESIAEVLRMGGYEVLVAPGGREALAQVDAERPDVILLDLLMPEMDGYEVCRLLKGDLQTREIPVVILTGFQDARCRDLAMGSGADEFLTKPFSRPELLARVGAVLRTRRLAQHLEEVRRGPAVVVPAPAHPGGSILLVEDEPEFSASVKELLEGTGLEVRTASSLGAGRAALSEAVPDVILLDLRLPDGDGLDLLREIKADPRICGASVVVLTAVNEVSAKVQGLELGADDYLVKPVSAVELRARIRNQLHAKRERDAILSRFSEISNQALLDGLTGLFNRRHLDETLPKIVDGAHRHRQNLCVIMADADHFKRVNDTFGHGAGDGVLQFLADLFRREVRAMDWVARFGGEEFVVVLPLTDIETALLVAERIRSRVEETPVHLPELKEPLRVTLSLGVAGLSLEGVSAPELLLRADKALYLAKRMGRNQIQAYGA